MHCKEHCWCRMKRKKKRPVELTINTDHVAVRGKNMKIIVVAQNTKNPVVDVLPPQVGKPVVLSWGLGYPAGTCGKSKKDFCPLQWDTKLYGPLALNGDLDEKATPAGPRQLTQCGSRCNGPSDCHASGNAGTCACAIPGPSDARALGLDPVFPPAVCLFVAAAIGNMNSRIGGKRNLDISLPTDQDGNHVQCLCNVTYISPSCCGTNDGRILGIV